MSKTAFASLAPTATKPANFIIVNGRTYFHEGEGVHKSSIPPEQAEPSEAHVLTGDKRKGGGWRIAWIFLVLPFVLGVGCCGLANVAQVLA